MQQVYVSDKGEDVNDGLSPEAPVKSLKRLCVLWSGRELVLMEGRETFNRLVDEMVVFVRFAKAASEPSVRSTETGCVIALASWLRGHGFDLCCEPRNCNLIVPYDD
jgi:hypothetical protein